MPRHSFMSSSFVRARPAVLALALAMLLSGCQGGATPSSSPTETSTTTAPPASSAPVPEASATPSAPAVYRPADAQGKAQNVPVPVMPELAKENSKAGLEAFLGYWYATYSYAIETGDLAAWEKITDTTIPVAVAHEKSVNLNHIDGRWMAGGRLTTPVIEVAWDDSESTTYSARVQVIQEAIQYFDAGGAKGQEDSAATNTADAVFAKYLGNAWKVTDYGTIVG
ncbi:DUF6318 family protein [Paenarthrobacter nitroguajacolicus]